MSEREAFEREITHLRPNERDLVLALYDQIQVERDVEELTKLYYLEADSKK